MRIAEMYLVCCNCKRIPEWTTMVVKRNEKGETVKYYEFEGACHFCKGMRFEVVEVRSQEWQRSSVSSAMNAVG